MIFAIDKQAGGRFQNALKYVEYEDFVFYGLSNVIKIMNGTYIEEEETPEKVVEIITDEKEPPLHFDEQCRLIEALESPEGTVVDKAVDNDE